MESTLEKLNDIDEKIITQNALNEAFNDNLLKVDEETIKKIDSPYELILILIDKANSVKENKDDILDFNLTEIIDDFLAITKKMQSLDMELTGSFLLVIADLILLKSRFMLKVDIDDGEETREEQQRRILVATKEYEIFKNLTQKLVEIDDPNKFEKEPDKIASEFRVVIKPMEADILSKALNKMLQRLATFQSQPAVQTINKERWTVKDKLFDISVELMSNERLSFYEMIDEDYTWSEIITTFRAILELIRRDDIAILQESDFGDIYIYRLATEEKLQEIYIEDYEEE